MKAEKKFYLDKHMNKRIVIEQLLETINNVINDIEDLSTKDAEFIISHEVAEQLRDELLSLSEE